MSYLETIKRLEKELSRERKDEKALGVGHPAASDAGFKPVADYETNEIDEISPLADESLGSETGPDLSEHIESCHACGSRLFWRSIYGVVICWRCHPPGADHLVTDIVFDGEVKWKQ